MDLYTHIEFLLLDILDKTPSIYYSFFTIALGIIIYSIKECIRYFNEKKIHKAKYNLEYIRPILQEAHIKVNKLNQAFIDTYNDIDSYSDLNLELLSKLPENERRKYEKEEIYRIYYNIETNINRLKKACREFIAFMNVNKIYFSNKIFYKVIEIDITVNTNHISLLKSIQKEVVEKKNPNTLKVGISEDYKRNQRDYRFLQDALEQEIEKQLKV